MEKISDTNNYELMIVVSSQFTDFEIKAIAFQYAQQLKKLGGLDISVISQGRREFAYSIKKIKNGYFIGICFSASPKLLPIYASKIKIDKNILRFLITKLEAVQKKKIF